MRSRSLRHSAGDSGAVRGWLLAGLTATALCFAIYAPSPLPARAQGNDSSVQPPKELTELRDALDDIDYLRILNQLKLTPDQEDKLISAITTAKANYTKKVDALGASIIVPLGDDIRAVKKAALAGAPIPKQFDAKVKKAEATFLAERGKLNAENLTSLAGAAKETFTAEQYTAAVKLAKDAAAKRNQPTEGTDAQWFNQFVVSEFINYPRIVPLLTEMRAAGQQ